MNHILLIIGSPASGKSTLSREIAKRSKKGLHIPVDDLRTMVHGGIVHPGYEWPPELTEQLKLARHTAIDMAMRYRDSDFMVVIDDFWDLQSHLREYDPLNMLPNVNKVVLRADINVTIDRLRSRQEPSAFRNALEDAIKMVNAGLAEYQEELIKQGWCMIDTSNDTIEESVERILAILDSSKE